MLERYDTALADGGNQAAAAFRGLHLALYEEAARALRAHFGPRGVDPAVADLACGLGHGADVLGGVYGRYLGLDASHAAIARCRAERAHDAAVRFEVADLEPAWAGDLGALGAFGPDAAVCLETLEHLRHPETLLRRLRTVLPPGGLLVASAPTLPSRDFDRFHRRDYTPARLARQLRRAGFRVLRRHDYAFRVPLAEAMRLARPSLADLCGLAGTLLVRPDYWPRRAYGWGLRRTFRWRTTLYVAIPG